MKPQEQAWARVRQPCGTSLESPREEYGDFLFEFSLLGEKVARAAPIINIE